MINYQFKNYMNNFKYKIKKEPLICLFEPNLKLPIPCSNKKDHPKLLHIWRVKPNHHREKTDLKHGMMASFPLHTDWRHVSSASPLTNYLLLPPNPIVTCTKTKSFTRSCISCFPLTLSSFPFF